MVDTTIVGENVEVAQVGARAPATMSWSVIIAGAIAATAVTFLIIALGTGIGMSVVSPYGENFSATTLTISGAVWLIIAESFGFATGGYLAGRLRTRTHVPGHETRFRDAAHGFMTWALAAGVAAFVALMAAAGLFGSAASVTSSAVRGATQTAAQAPMTEDTVGYFVDSLLRSGTAAPAGATPGSTPADPPATAPAPAPAAPAATGNDEAQRAEIGRILLRAAAQGGLQGDDRAYLARIVAARTGLPQPQAEQRVAEVETQARNTIKDAAEAARKATAYLSFWTFMAMLFGAMAAMLGGILGGELRDEV